MGSLIDVERILEPYKILRNTDTLCVATIRQNILECPTVKAIPKADVVAMLEEIKDELKHTDLSGVWKPNYKEGFNDSVATSVKKIQCKIDKLKENNK